MSYIFAPKADSGIVITASQVSDFNEAAQDAVGGILTDTTSVDFTYNDAANTISAVVLPAGVDHNTLANLTIGDVHTQYAFLAGRSGGQSLSGGTASGNALTLRSTSHATKGSVVFGNAGNTVYDEVNERLGIGTATPFTVLDARMVTTSTTGMQYIGFFRATTTGTPQESFGSATLWYVQHPNENQTAAGVGGSNGPLGSNECDLVFLSTSTSILAERWRITSLGHLTASLDNAYDVGASGEKRPRSLYLGQTLFLAAGTASSTPLKFISGSLLTSPQAGAAEFLTDDYYVTQTTGPTRKLLGFIPAQSDVTASRALNTTYTAPSTRSIAVCATARCAISSAGGNSYLQGKSDGSTPPTTAATGIVGIEVGLLGEDNSFQIQFVVAPGQKYRLDSSTTNGTAVLGKWFEISF